MITWKLFVLSVLMLSRFVLEATAQTMSMDTPAVRRILTTRQPLQDATTQLSVLPAEVIHAGRQVRGVFTVVADPVYRRLWWSFRDMTFMPTATAMSLADEFEQRHLVYPTPDRLLVFSSTRSALLIGFGREPYGRDIDLPAVVRAAFDVRAPGLRPGGQGQDGFDHYEKEVALWSAIGKDFFVEPLSAAPVNQPIRLVSALLVDDHWEITVEGRVPGQLAVVILSLEFEVTGVVRTSAQ